MNEMNMDGGKWVTKRAMAAHWGCTVRTVGNLMRRKVIPYVKVRGLLRFNLHECEAALRRYRASTLLEHAHAPPEPVFPQPPQAPVISPPPPLGGPPTPIILQGDFEHAEQVLGAVRSLLPDLETGRPDLGLPLQLEAGSWVLLLYPARA